MLNENGGNYNRPTPKNDRSSGPQFPLPPWVRIAIWLTIIGLVLLQLPGFVNPFGGERSITIPYSVFFEQVSAGNVEEVTLSDGAASGRFIAAVQWPPDGSPEDEAQPTSSTRFETILLPVDDPQLTDLLRDNNVTINAEMGSDFPVFGLLVSFAPLLLIVGFFIWSSRRAQDQIRNQLGFGRSQAREYSAETPQVSFDDVAGQDSAKNELTEIVDFLRDPDKYISLGARIPRGVLLIGPPGTGKTLLARAIAGEAGVAFFSLSASEFVEMFVGVGASRVRDLFKRAKAIAPSIVFIDEIDAVGRQRGTGLGGGHDEREQTLNQLLAAMDGFDQNESVIVLAATNRPDVLDPALLRPGRFDRQVTVALPDRNGREAILNIHVRGKPLAADVDLETLARSTVGFSGADLANLANEAALSAARHVRKQLKMGDFLEAFDRIVLGSESPPLANAQERKVVAYHEAGHALAASLTPEADPVLKVTIIPRGQALGVTAQMPTDDHRNYSREYLMARLVVLLAGRSAEELAIGQITTGAENDLREATRLARRMVTQWGMSEHIGSLNFGDDDRHPFLGYSLAQGRNYSEETARQIDDEVRRIVEAAHEQSQDLLQAHQHELATLAGELLANEVVEQARILEIIAGTAREAGADTIANRLQGRYLNRKQLD